MRPFYLCITVGLASLLGACVFDDSGVRFDHLDDPQDQTPTLSPPNVDDRAPVGDFPDGGVVAARCLIISEYLEGDGNNNKAIELFNCGTTPLHLSDYGVCLVRNEDTSCSNTTLLADTELAAGAVYTLCRTKEGTALDDPMDPLRDACHQVSTAMTFNGDDRLIVFRDDDGSGTFDQADEVMDAFGRIDYQPTSYPWSELDLRRCNFNRADGLGEFVHTDYFTEHPREDASNFGVAPTEGC